MASHESRLAMSKPGRLQECVLGAVPHNFLGVKTTQNPARRIPTIASFSKHASPRGSGHGEQGSRQNLTDLADETSALRNHEVLPKHPSWNCEKTVGQRRCVESFRKTSDTHREDPPSRHVCLSSKSFQRFTFFLIWGIFRTDGSHPLPLGAHSSQMTCGGSPIAGRRLDAANV